MAWVAVAAVAAPMVGQAIFGDSGQGAANAASAAAAGQSAVTSAQQAAIAQDQWDTYKTQFSPVNTQLSGMALAAGTPAQIASEGAIAGATATQQAGLADAAKTRALSRSGVNPNSGNGLALAQENANTTALATTGAINSARKTSMDTAFAKTLDTVNAGNRVASNATTGLSSATTGAAYAAKASADVAANAGLANASFNNGLAGIGKAVGGWMNTPSSAGLSSTTQSGPTTSLGSGFYNPNGFGG